MKKKAEFIKLIQMWGFVFLMGLGVGVVAVDVIGSYRDFNFRADQMRADYIARQKQTIKQEVDRVVAMIRYEKQQSENLTRNKIKARVYEAYSIAQNIYRQNQAVESKAKIQQMILDAIRPIRFENGSGYYFATRLDGVEVLFADRPQMEKLNLLNMQDTRGRFVIKDMIEIANQPGEGFYEYHWTKPESAGNDFKKISFIKRFAPYDWFIGTGLYVDDVETQIKAGLLAAISRIRFGKEGYIFVNKFNGDALVSNGKRLPGTKKLWEVFNDNPEKMKDIFQKEHIAALKPQGDFIYYSHIKLTNPNEESPKASFIFGIPELQWLVGAGVYLDDVETDIALMQTGLNNQISVKLLYYILIIMAMFAAYFLFFNRLTQGLKKDFTLFISFFNRAAHSDEEIDREHIKFVELDRVAEYANKMLADRKQAEASLRESEAKFRAMVENSPMGIAIVNDAYQFVYVNDKFCSIAGYQKNELLGNNFSFFIAEESREQAVLRYLLRQKGGQVPDHYDFLFIRKSGEKRHGEVQSVVYRDNAGRVNSLLQVNDITERTRAEKEKTELEAQLQQARKMDAVGRLAGGVAHDFNNMLGVILGHAELALDRINAIHPVHADLEEIRKAARRSADLTRQLLAFARKQTISPKVLDLNETVEGMLKMLSRLIGENIDLVWSPGEEVWPVKVDPGQIDQILTNLCINARDAIPGVGKITIETKNATFDDDYCADHAGFAPGDFVVLAVSDDGSGMDKETLNKLFEPFFTTKEMGKGTGLGLATIYGIVKQNNGFINVYSELQNGTTFRIYIPQHTAMKEKMQKKGPAAPVRRGHETILLVEDEPSILEMTTIMLERQGYSVVAASSPGEAIRLAGEHAGEIHLLMTDVVMPEMNGKDLAKKMLSLNPNLKRLFMSGYTANVIAHHGVLEEGVHFIQKPFSMQEIAAKVREALDNAK